MTPKTNAGKALVEWAQNAAPNQIDVWRDHAALIEAEAYNLAARMIPPDVKEQQPVLDAERLARAIGAVAKSNPPYPGLPVHRTIPEAAAAYAAEYARLQEQDR